MIVFVEAYARGDFDAFGKYFFQEFRSTRTVTLYRMYENERQSCDYIMGRLDQIFATNIQYRHEHIFIILGGFYALRKSSDDYAMHMNRIIRSRDYKNTHIYMIAGDNMPAITDGEDREKNMRDITSVLSKNVQHIMDDRMQNKYNLLMADGNQTVKDIVEEIAHKLSYFKTHGKTYNGNKIKPKDFNAVLESCSPLNRKEHIKSYKVLATHKKQLDYLENKYEKAALLVRLNYTTVEIADFLNSTVKNINSLISNAKKKHIMPIGDDVGNKRVNKSYNANGKTATASEMFNKGYTREQIMEEMNTNRNNVNTYISRGRAAGYIKVKNEKPKEKVSNIEKVSATHMKNLQEMDSKCSQVAFMVKHNYSTKVIASCLNMKKKNIYSLKSRAKEKNMI